MPGPGQLGGALTQAAPLAQRAPGLEAQPGALKGDEAAAGVQPAATDAVHAAPRDGESPDSTQYEKAPDTARGPERSALDVFEQSRATDASKAIDDPVKISSAARAAVDDGPAAPEAEAPIELPGPGTGDAADTDSVDPESTTPDARAARKDADNPEGLTDSQLRQVSDLEARDREVRAHEQAHKAVGGALAGAISYSYQTGPDRRRYAVGGEVPVDIAAGKDPQQTVQKMDRVRRAALAPAKPSGADRAVAARATQLAGQARVEAREIKADEARDARQATVERRDDVEDAAESRQDDAEVAREERTEASDARQSLAAEASEPRPDATPAPSADADAGESTPVQAEALAARRPDRPEPPNPPKIREIDFPSAPPKPVEPPDSAPAPKIQPTSTPLLSAYARTLSGT